MDSDSFKQTVKEYTELHDDLLSSGKAIRELKKRKDELGAQILEAMRENEIDECTLPDGKLVRRQAKRTEPLKKDHIVGELKNVLQPTDVNDAIEKMYGQRETTTKDMLSRRKK